MSVFISIEIRTNYHDKNFAMRIASKERVRGTRKWSIFDAPLASRVLAWAWFFPVLSPTTCCLQVTSCTIVSYLFQKPTPLLCIGPQLLVGNELSLWGKKNIGPTIEIPLNLNAPKMLVLPACRLSPESRASCVIRPLSNIGYSQTVWWQVS